MQKYAAGIELQVVEMICNGGSEKLILYRLEIVFDMNYEQFVGGEIIADDPCIIS